MRVLILTTHEAGLIDQQRAALEDRGVSFEQVVVPGPPSADDVRSPLQYLKVYPEVLSRSLQSFDLIHANNGAMAPFALAQPRLPVVLSLWGSDLYGPFGPVSRFCSRLCDETVVMSERMRDDLGQDAAVVPHGIDFEKFQPIPRSDARAAVGWDPDEDVVLFPYPKDRQVKNYPRAKRLVERASDRLGRTVDLRTVSGLPHDEVPAYMNAADVLLLPSDHEGSPNVVKEALAVNTPVVATDVGDVEERAGHLDGSTVSDHDDSLVDGLVDALDREDRPETRTEVRDVSIQRTSSWMYDVYRRAAAVGPSPTVQAPAVTDGGDEG